MFARPSGRPVVVAVVSMLVVVGLLVAGCAGPGQQQEEEKVALPVAGHFVGDATPSTARHTFVAILASSAEEGEDTREVRAYLCDGEQISEWFRGSVTGDDLELTSEDGAELQGTLTPDNAAGTITLNDGKSLTFAAKPAAGPAGLYSLTISPDGTFNGISERGGRIEGEISEEVDSQGERQVSATVVPPGEQSADFETTANNASPGDARLILSEDLHAVGSGLRDGDKLAFRVCGELKMVLGNP